MMTAAIDQRSHVPMPHDNLPATPRIEEYPTGAIGPEVQEKILNALSALEDALKKQGLDPVNAWKLGPYAGSEDAAISEVACRILREHYSVMRVQYEEEKVYTVSPVLLAAKTRVFPEDMVESLKAGGKRICPIGVSESGFRLLQRVWEGTPIEELIANDEEGKILGELYDAADYCNCQEVLDLARLVKAIAAHNHRDCHVCYIFGKAHIRSMLWAAKEVTMVQRFCRLFARCNIPVLCDLETKGPNFLANLANLLNDTEKACITDLHINDFLEPAGARALAGILAKNHTLLRLRLDNTRLGKEGILALSEALKENTTLEQISFCNKRLGNHEAAAVAEMLKVNTTLKNLDLGGNLIGADGVRLIAAALKENGTLRALLLAGNNIGTWGGEALAEALQENKGLQVLSVANNGLTGQGANALAKALEENDTLQELHLYSNDIGDEGAEALAAALKKNKAVKTLLLGGNPKISNAGHMALIDALRQNDALRTLSLFDNRIDPETEGALRELDKLKPGLKILYHCS